MKKFLRKLLPTIVMLAVSATLVGTSTFAWFSMNNKVTVTGMMVKTKVSSNLWIAEDTLGETTKKDDSLFKNSINQVVKGFLQPVSTADGINFFYTTNANVNGSVADSSAEFTKYNASSAALNSSAYADKFAEDYGVTLSDATFGPAVPYVDYTFQLKAANTSGSDQYIVAEKLVLRYMGSDPGTRAHRIKFFVVEYSGSAYPTYTTGSSATYTVASSANFIENTNSSSVTSGSVVNGTTSSSYTTASYVDEKQALVTVPEGTHWYKVVARMWLEGQDDTCYSDKFIPLTEQWELDMRLALVNDTSTATININQTDSSGTLAD